VETAGRKILILATQKGIKVSACVLYDTKLMLQPEFMVATAMGCLQYPYHSVISEGGGIDNSAWKQNPPDKMQDMLW